MENLKRTQIVRKWYNSQSPKFEMIKYLQNREGAILLPKHYKKIKIEGFKGLRNYRLHTVQSINYLIGKYTVWGKKGFNIYRSVAIYDQPVPMRNPHSLEIENPKFWEEHHKHIIKYDFFLDIDLENNISQTLLKARKELYTLICDLDKHDIPYEVIFSGMGFHLNIPEENMSYPDKKKSRYNPKAKFNIYQHYSQIAKVLKNKYSKSIDLNIYDSRRLQKVPYSLAIYPTREYVCMPIHDRSTIQTFLIEIVKPEYLISKDIRGRGSYVFNEGGKGTILQLLENGKKEKK